MIRKTLLLTLMMTFPIWNCATAFAQVFEFNNPQQEELYLKVIKELRCLVCQNQNLADSNADLAKDLRRKSYEMVNDGKSYEEIIHYMEQRYGDFVLYRPKLKSSTWFLWFSPFLLLIVLILVVIAKRRTPADVSETILSDSDKARLNKILNE